MNKLIPNLEAKIYVNGEFKWNRMEKMFTKKFIYQVRNRYYELCYINGEHFTRNLN